MRFFGSTVFPAITICGIATTVTNEPGEARAFPVYHGGSDVSADHTRASADTRIVDDIVATSLSDAVARTETRIALPTGPAVTSALYFPLPERSARNCPFIVHS